MKDIKVSIVIPTYNRSQFLSNAIESALKQDYKNIEIIINDDCSTDDTTLIVSKYLSDKRVKYFKNYKNFGAVKNFRTAALGRATGDWICVISDDDYIQNSDAISLAVQKIKKDKDINFIVPRFIFQFDSFKQEEPVRILPEIFDGIEYLQQNSMDGLLVIIMVKREILTKYNILTSDQGFFEERDVNMLLLNGKGCYLKDFRYCFKLNVFNALQRNRADKSFISVIKHI